MPARIGDVAMTAGERARRYRERIAREMAALDRYAAALRRIAEADPPLPAEQVRELARAEVEHRPD